ncbi:MAG: VOC family protein [Thermoplasmatota archaeon]
MNTIKHTEFASNDTKASMAFFSKVFGWEFSNNESSPMGEYNMAGDGTNSVAVRPLMEQEPHPYATPYVTVESLEETEKAVVAAGGEIMVSNVQVEYGSFTWFKVPGDFFIAIWEDAKPDA